MLSRSICLLFLTLGLAAQQPVTPAPAPAAPPSAAPSGFQINGTVVHALNGEPIAGAEVVIASTSNPNQLQTAVSEANGHFLFKDVAPGKYTLAAKHRGFPQQAFDGHGPFSTGIAVGPEKTSENILFRLKPEGSISGRVTDEQDDPIRNAAVMLFVRHSDTGERTTDLSIHGATDDQGSYHFGHLPTGTYFVAVSAKPWYAYHDPSGSRVAKLATTDNSELDVAYPITYYRQTIEPEAATPITLSWGDHLTADISLRAVPAIHLRLSNQNPNSSLGIEGATLKQTLIGGNVTFVETQIENISPNVIEISGIPPGRYDMGVETSKEKNGGISTNSRHQTLNVQSNGAVDAAAGSELATVTGAVIFDDQHNPPQEASLQLHNRESGQQFEIPVSPKGEFDSPEVSPGHYDLILLNSEGFILKSISALNAKVVGQSVEISGSDHVQLALVASKGNGRVEGVVRRDNKPIAGAMIVLVPQDPANNWPLFRRDQSDSDGTFELSSVLPGKYTVLAIENGWDLEWANPAVLQPYMSKGEAVQVESSSKISLTVKCSVADGSPEKVHPVK